MTAGIKKSDDLPEDIDLLLLLERVISYLKRFRWHFISAIVLGLIAGYLFYLSIPKTYRSRMVVHSFILTNPEQMQIVNNWNSLLKQKEFTSLSILLNCPEEVLQQVNLIKPKEIQQAFTPSNPNGFTIDVLVTDINVLDTLQKAIVYGFENSEYIKEKLLVKRNILKELISKTSDEIKKLDSTKKRMESIIDGSGRSSSTLIIDGSTVNRQLIEMNEKLLSFKENLQFTNAVQVLQSFSKFKKADGPKLLSWLLIGLIFFICLTWAATVLYSINEKLKRRKFTNPG